MKRGERNIKSTTEGEEEDERLKKRRNNEEQRRRWEKSRRVEEKKTKCSPLLHIFQNRQCTSYVSREKRRGSTRKPTMY